MKIHTRQTPLADDVNLRRVAQATPGFSGADLANVANEAALLAGRHEGRSIRQKDFEEAVEKVVAGPKRKSRILTARDKRLVAYHEMGHALVAALSPHPEPVRKISIVPRGRTALGYTLQLPAEDRYLMSRSELLDKIKGLLGGRAAEELVFSDVTTGAENDLEHATALARQMVCLFGMSDAIGLARCAQREAPFIPDPRGPFLQRDCSEQTAREIDQEVRKILDEAYAAATGLLRQHREQLDRLAGELLERETMDEATFRQLLQVPIRTPAERARNPDFVGR